jgi:ribonuclease-3
VKPARPKRTRQRAAAKATRPSLSGAKRGEVEEILGHVFKDVELLTQALTHPSAISSAEDMARQSNQRLEFLGDRVLNLIVSERLYARYPDWTEGQMAPKYNQLIKKGACAEAMRHLDLGLYIIAPPGQQEAGLTASESALGDACEAIVGALYLDGGLKAATRFVEKAWAPQFNAKPRETKDPKSLFQEWAQARGLPEPDYVVLEQTGPDHAPEFHIEARLDGHGIERASGPSKRAAERAAAAAFYSRLTRT